MRVRLVCGAGFSGFGFLYNSSGGGGGGANTSLLPSSPPLLLSHPLRPLSPPPSERLLWPCPLSLFSSLFSLTSLSLQERTHNALPLPQHFNPPTILLVFLPHPSPPPCCFALHPSSPPTASSLKIKTEPWVVAPQPLPLPQCWVPGIQRAHTLACQHETNIRIGAAKEKKKSWRSTEEKV